MFSAQGSLVTNNMVYDVFFYNGELDVLRIHLNVMNDHVDRFIIVEATKTFTGKDKHLYFFQHERYVEKYWKKIDYFVINKWDDQALWDMAAASPNTKGADHWKMEFYQKEFIQKAIKKLRDDDLCIIGDVDEIIDPTVEFRSETPVKAKLRVYAYYLNNLSDEQFWGTLMAQYKDIKGNCLNHMRSDPSLRSQGEPLGWHFTSIGGEQMVRRKLNDSYTEQSYNTPEVQSLLSERLQQRVDYLGRPFVFLEDESNWPMYLKQNREKYEHLLIPKIQ